MKLDSKTFLISLLTASLIFHADLSEPTSLSKDLYVKKILDGSYLENIDHPDTFLDFGYGERVANPAQISAAIQAYANQSDRIKVVEYGRTHENRSLYAVFISSPENIGKLEEIKADITLLSDPRKINDSKANSIINSLPAVAWMAYSIHGNETSGADAALGLIYHLIASTDQSIIKMLENMVVIVDPMMNPDGRDRFAKSLEQYRGTAPNYDDQSLLHSGDWPSGRTNHYFFDLNRDWFYQTQPETQGRVPLINAWRPQILVDGHEMGAQDTFMTGPPREPINTNVDKDIIKWGNVFADEQAKAFDENNWRFYTGEWHEDLYPGYSFYVQFRGSLGILYEQSRMAEDGVRRQEGTIQSYKESVHHQFTSSISNLKTLEKHSKHMYQDYWDGRKYNVSRDGEYANQTYVVLATENQGRINTLAKKLSSQDIEIYVNTKPIKVGSTLKQNGETMDDFLIPAGSLVIPNLQPEAPLISAILEFDAEIIEPVLKEERRKTLKNGSSIMYDTTAFNLTMMYGLEAVTVNQNLQRDLEPWAAVKQTDQINDDALMWVVNGIDDRSVPFAARLMELGVEVRIIDKESVLSNQDFPRGSIAVIAMDNPNYQNLSSTVEKIASELSLEVASVTSGFGAEELPDWGGRHFRLLVRPQVAILSYDDFSSYDVGVSWWAMDHYLGIRHSQINGSALNYTDLRRYNTIIMPSGRGFSNAQLNALRDWVRQGGTLIANNSSSRSLTSDNGIGSVKQLGSTFDNSSDYNINLQREFEALNVVIDVEKTNDNKVNYDLAYPWENNKSQYSKPELEKRDAWQSRFMPSGAFVAGRIDDEHWLTFGTIDTLPLLYSNYPVLMTNQYSEAVVRVGELVDNPEAEGYRSINWSDLPPGKDLNVRMSGLVWPEASQRIANSAYLTRERVGRGQVILFAGEPNFRGAAHGTNRLWLNAVVYGAGLGAADKIDL